MNDFKLPDELATIEQDLALALPADPPAALRERVLSHDPTPRLKNGNGSRRRFLLAAVAATVVLVWMNMSLFASNSINLERPLATTVDSPDETESRAAMLDELIPNLDAKESRGLSILCFAHRRGTNVSQETLIQNLPPFH